ncbi:MAG: hypothetical protein WD294_08725 [Phycisphaeraceae bacterium]
MKQSRFDPEQVHHVVCCDRVFHVVADQAGEDEHVAWCLEFPDLTATGQSYQTVLERITNRIELVYRDQL